MVIFARMSMALLILLHLLPAPHTDGGSIPATVAVVIGQQFWVQTFLVLLPPLTIAPAAVIHGITNGWNLILLMPPVLPLFPRQIR